VLAVSGTGRLFPQMLAPTPACTPLEQFQVRERWAAYYEGSGKTVRSNLVEK